LQRNAITTRIQPDASLRDNKLTASSCIVTMLRRHRHDWRIVASRIRRLHLDLTL
jgi:hypothetical protein